MRILIITTIPNSVLNSLQTIHPVELDIVDCAENYQTIGQRVKEVVTRQKPDMILTYRCPYILSENIFLTAKLGAYNIHPSLLPKNAGLNPWSQFFLKKENVNGVTLHKITNRVDKGEVIYQKEYRIESYDTIDTARQKADYIAAELAIRLIRSLMQVC